MLRCPDQKVSQNVSHSYIVDKKVTEFYYSAVFTHEMLFSTEDNIVCKDR